MEILSEILKRDYILQIISLSKQKKRKLYLVGGFLRDAILGRQKEIIDLDFAVDRGAIDLARSFANRTKSGFVVLDKEHGCARVVFDGHTLDFTDFRGKDLKGDLLHRDFTINTLALPLPCKNNINVSLVDHCRAKKDLKQGIIRMTSKLSFVEDPLRILRAFSLSAIFNFKIESKTLQLAKKKKKSLAEVSSERIRDELFKILNVPNSYTFINNLDKAGILSIIIPQIELMRNMKQGAYHHLDVWRHSLETLRQFDNLLSEIKDEDICGYLKEIIVGDRKRTQMLRLVCLLHDIGKPQAFKAKEGKTIFHGHERIGRDISEAISDRLKLSTREKLSIETMIFWHLRPGYLADNIVLTERAKFRYFRDAGDEAISILLLSISDQRATRGPMADPKSRIKHEKVAFDLMKEYFVRKRQKKFVCLINGNDLIKTLKLKPSPLFKIILQEIEESQAEGKVKTKKEALALAKKLAKDKKYVKKSNPKK